MSRQTSSISRIGRTEPFNLQVARGQISGHSVRNIFGTNPSIGVDFRTPWEVTGALPFLSAPQQLSLVSTSASDTAVSILVDGVDGNYDPVREVVALNGTAAVTTTRSFFRINDLITTAGNAVGDVTASHGGIVYAKILAGFGRNQAAVFTVPRNFSFFLLRIDLFSATAKNDNKILTFRNKITFSDGRVFNVAQTSTLQRLDIQRQLPFVVDETTTIEFQARISSQTADAGIFGEGYLIQKQGPL
jgi:hypothetical protein